MDRYIGLVDYATVATIQIQLIDVAVVDERTHGCHNASHQSIGSGVVYRDMQILLGYFKLAQRCILA